MGSSPQLIPFTDTSRLEAKIQITLKSGQRLKGREKWGWGGGDNFHFKMRVKSQMWGARPCPSRPTALQSLTPTLESCLAISSGRRACDPAVPLFGTYPGELNPCVPREGHAGRPQQRHVPVPWAGDDARLLRRADAYTRRFVPRSPFSAGEQNEPRTRGQTSACAA